MRCSENLFDALTPSPADNNKHGIQEIFHTIFREKSFNKTITVYAITIETAVSPGARVVCETYRSDGLQETRTVGFSSVDAAVVEAGRLAHNKMCNGFHYRMASADTSLRDSTPLAIA